MEEKRRKRRKSGKLSREGASKKEGVRGRVGVDSGERREAGVGVKGRGKEVKVRRSSHGLIREEGSGRELGRPRKSGREVKYSRGKSEGEGEVMKERGPVRREGGRVVGWESRRVPNRYDYYREGHRVNRVSGNIAKRSQGGRIK